ncbi:unnamed protein product [Boreogadus saida]
MPGSISSSPQPDLSGLGHVLLLSVLSLSRQRDKGEQSIKEKNSPSLSPDLPGSWLLMPEPILHDAGPPETPREPGLRRRAGVSVK